jgi:hypothetical protein
VGIQNRDEGVVSDVIFFNRIIEGHLCSDVWWGKAGPIYITAYRHACGNNKDANWRFSKGAAEGRVGEVTNIFFSNIKCASENGVYVSAKSTDKIANIVFYNADVWIDKIKKRLFLKQPLFAERTGLEPATSAVTGQHSNQLNYRSGNPAATCKIKK